MSERSVPNGPNPAMIFETLNAYQRTGALRAAIDLRVFSVIHDRPKNAGASSKVRSRKSRLAYSIS